MLTVIGLASSLIAYAFVAGIVHRVLTKLSSGSEDMLAAVWPLIPLVYAMVGVAWLLETGTMYIVNMGRLAAEVSGRTLARWRRRGLHDDCMANWTRLRTGGDPLRVPFGACTRCAPRLERLAASRLPRARVVP
jgi:hypothetical protein